MAVDVQPLQSDSAQAGRGRFNMMTRQEGLFIQLASDSNQRVLLPAVLIEQTDESWTVQFESEAPSVEAEQSILVYREIQQEFMQQAAQVIAVQDGEASEGPCTFAFRFTGEPVSAESRQCYRVSALMSNLHATLHGDDHCPLVDVSNTGFAVISSHQYSLGETLKTELWYEEDSFPGLACVQSVMKLGAGRYRYGFHALTDKRARCELQRGLQFISTEVQRQQLRRRTGAA
jgi:hypothetical protein